MQICHSLAAALRPTVPDSDSTTMAVLGFPESLCCLRQRCGCPDNIMLCRLITAFHVGWLCKLARQAHLLLMSQYQSSSAISQHMLPPFYAQLLSHRIRQCEGLAATERQHILPRMVLLSADASGSQMLHPDSHIHLQ